MPNYTGSEILRSNPDYSVADTDNLRGTWKRVATKGGLLIFKPDKVKLGQPVYVDDADGNGNPSVFILTDINNYTDPSYSGWTELAIGGAGVSDWNSITGKPDLYTESEIDNFLSSKADGVDLSNHVNDTNNPHSVNKSQVGLGNVPNIDTTDAVNNEHTHSNKTELDLITDGDHDIRTDNPHNVDKTDVGLSNVPNLDTTDAVTNEHTHSNKSILDNIQEALTSSLKTAYDNAVTWINTNGTNLLNHLSSNNNPHSVTKSQVGLGNVPDLNTTDAVNKAHDQNTDTGTNNNTFHVDSSNNGPKAKNNSGELEVRNSGDTDFTSIQVSTLFKNAIPQQNLTGQSGDISIDFVNTGKEAFSYTIAMTDSITECIFTNGYRGQEIELIVSKDDDYYAFDFAQPYDESAGSSIGDYVLEDNKVYKCNTAQTAGSSFDVANYDLFIKFEREVVPVLTYGTSKKDKFKVRKESNYYLVSVQHDV